MKKGTRVRCPVCGREEELLISGAVTCWGDVEQRGALAVRHEHKPAWMQPVTASQDG